MINMYILYDKFPWDLGYPPYAEFDNLFPFVIKELHKKEEHKRKTEKDFDDQKNSR